MSTELSDRAAQAAGVGCAALVDAMGRHHSHRAHLPAFTSPDPTRPLFGPASTIAYLPFRDDLSRQARARLDVVAGVPQDRDGGGDSFYESAQESRPEPLRVSKEPDRARE